jgi:hypothetical protein
MMGGRREKLVVLGSVLTTGMCLGLQAMERWAALAQLESGNDDRARGAVGEISRYQIRPDVWRHYATPNADFEKPSDALTVAKEVMGERCAAFERTFHRAPTDFEFYVLWNAPAQIEHPSRAVAKRAQYFCNLVARR